MVLRDHCLRQRGFDDLVEFFVGEKILGRHGVFLHGHHHLHRFLIGRGDLQGLEARLDGVGDITSLLLGRRCDAGDRLFGTG